MFLHLPPLRRIETPAAIAEQWCQTSDTEFTGILKVLNQGDGYIVLRGFPLDKLSESERDSRYLAFAAQFGRVTLHGGSQSAIWHVSPSAKAIGRQRTFSEMADEAPLHTDSSFILRPETYFALLVVRPASSGGNSICLPIQEVLAAFRKHPGGTNAIRVLTEREFPFTTPAAFSNSAASSEKNETVVAPVFGRGIPVRFRMDCILAGFAARPDLATPDRVEAIHLFNDFLRPFMHQEGQHLEAGDLFIGNNHRVLHARTNFEDPNRLLLRVRITG